MSSVLLGALGIPPRNAPEMPPSESTAKLRPTNQLLNAGSERVSERLKQHTYSKEGRTKKPMSFLNQTCCSSDVTSCRGDVSSHTTWMYWQSGSQKGSSNSRKILLLVPKPIFLIASAFSVGSGGSKKVSRCSLRKPGIHKWTQLIPRKSHKLALTATGTHPDAHQRSQRKEASKAHVHSRPTPAPAQLGSQKSGWLWPLGLSLSNQHRSGGT